MRLLNKIRVLGIAGNWRELRIMNKNRKVGICRSFLGWEAETNGVPQSSMLELQLLTNYHFDSMEFM